MHDTNRITVRLKKKKKCYVKLYYNTMRTRGLNFDIPLEVSFVYNKIIMIIFANNNNNNSLIHKIT